MEKQKQHPYQGKNVLVTTQDWFMSPDGNQRKAVFGVLKGIHETKDLLGFIPNRHHANWTLEIGNTSIAGCQVLYMIQVDDVALGDVEDYTASTIDDVSPIFKAMTDVKISNNQDLRPQAKRYMRPSMIYDAREINPTTDHHE